MAKGTVVEFATPHGAASGYAMAMVHGRGRPGIVVVQEWWGVVAHIKDVVNRFALEGYDALAVDLYHGASAVDAAEARHMMDTLDWDRAVEEIEAAVDYLREIDHTTRVGVVGFSMGGALAVLAARHPGVAAYASFYGFPPDSAKIGAIATPGVLFFGEHEEVFSVADARAFAERQRASGIDTTVVVYPKAGHAFFNDARVETYRRDAAKAAWAKTLVFFRELLENRDAQTPLPERRAQFRRPDRHP